jgi:hypothetical protein
MESKPTSAPTEAHIKEMLAFFEASGRPSFSLDEATGWCETRYPKIHTSRFGAFLREAAANRKRPTKGMPVADLVWQLTPTQFIPYDPATDPAPGSIDAAAWMIKLALQEREHVENVDVVGTYCKRLAAAMDLQKDPDEILQVKVEGLAGLIRANKMESYLSQASELSAASYFQAIYPASFQNHVKHPIQEASGQPKNFDFSFQTDGARFNVEVKAFSKPYDKADTGGTKYFLPESVKQQLYDLGAEITPNLSPTIGSFLVDANDQLFRRGDDLNVALICCNDPDEYADVFESFHGPFGMVRASRSAGNSPRLPDSILPNITLLKNIDAVVVCLIGFLHCAIVNTHRFDRAYGGHGDRLAEPELVWDFRHSFPSGFWLHRPPAEPKKEIEFQKVFNSHTWILKDYYRQHRSWQQAVFSLINHKAT